MKRKAKKENIINGQTTFLIDSKLFSNGIENVCVEIYCRRQSEHVSKHTIYELLLAYTPVIRCA